VPIVVNSLNRKFRGRATTHIFEKIGENSPSFANLYASLSVVFKVWISWVVAALFYSLPTRIFDGFAARNCFAMLREKFYESFFAETSTTSCHLSAQPICSDQNGISTRTFAKPNRITERIVWSTMGYRKTTEGLTSEINKARHRAIILQY
jgi:hypothetical protein